MMARLSVGERQMQHSIARRLGLTKADSFHEGAQVIGSLGGAFGGSTPHNALLGFDVGQTSKSADQFSMWIIYDALQNRGSVRLFQPLCGEMKVQMVLTLSNQCCVTKKTSQAQRPARVCASSSTFPR
jgi:hypothetical protein